MPRRRLTGDPKMDAEMMMQNLRHIEAWARFGKDYYPFNVQRRAAAADMDTGALWYDNAADLLRFRNKTADIVVATIMAMTGFTWVNIAISQVNNPGTRLYADPGGPVFKATKQGIVVPWDGHIISLSYTGTANKTAGTLTMKGRINGTQVTSAVAMTNGTNKGYQSWSPGVYPFVAGDELSVSMDTDAALLPAGTLDIEAVLYIARSQ